MEQPPASKLNGVFIIPTGINCALGGDAAYAPGVKLIASCCDKLLVNPNAVNASDINEMSANCLYTEGSIIDRFLEGQFKLLQPKSYNKILVVVNKPAIVDNLVAMKAAIWSLGADITMIELDTPLELIARINPDGTADGDVIGWQELCEQVKSLDFDVLTIHTPIDCDMDTVMNYWNNGGVNPWGAVEAKLSKLVGNRLNKQAVHSPISPEENEATPLMDVKMTMAPEMMSLTYAFCMFKGVHRAPKLDLTMESSGLSNKDIDFMVSPMCWGRPHDACLKSNIPVIIVKENTTCLTNVVFPDNKNVIFVNNYLEAAGVVQCLNAGVNFKTVLL